MKKIRLLTICMLFLGTPMGYSDEILSNHRQLMVVTSQDWDQTQAYLQRYERTAVNQTWKAIGETVPVVLGKTGLVWGIGLQPFPLNTQLPVKREGDYKSPAGIFSIGTVFGFAPCSEMTHLKMDYLHLDDSIEAVDDPQSQYYNCIVDRCKVNCDWQSSEKMSKISLYELGFVIHHNFPNPKLNGGSAIFCHLWRNENCGTAGCTAMDYDNLNRIVNWLDKEKNPVLIQLTKALYEDLSENWNLPN